MKNAENLISYLNDSIRTNKRDDGTIFYYFDYDEKSQWYDSEMNASLHGTDILPNDYRFKIITSLISDISSNIQHYESLEELSDDRDSFINPLQDIYTTDLLHWFSSHLSRLDYVENAKVDNVTPDASIIDCIAMGQYLEIDEMFTNILELLEKSES